MPYVEASVRSRQFVAAARRVMARDGIANASLRAVAAEAEVPLGTLQYVFPSKELLFRAVFEDVVEEMAGLLRSAVSGEQGLAHAIGDGVRSFWTQLVEEQPNAQILQYEMINYALRTPGQEHMARWQYERYTREVAQWCQEAAGRAGEVCALPFDRLARIILAAVDGLNLQYASDPDRDRARGDLDAMIEMVVDAARIHRSDD